MSVHEQRYRCHRGPWTPEQTRFSVLARYALRAVFAKKSFLIFFAACFVSPLIFGIFIYLHHNAEALAVLSLPLDELVPIDAEFFLLFVRIQAFLAFLLTLLVAPALVSADLRDNALPLVLSRPLSRFDYVVGKFCVLAILLSAVTWVPGLVLFGLQTALEGLSWLGSNLRIAAALVAGSWVWLAVLSLLGLAVSALVRSKPAAGALLFAAFFVSSALGALINELFQADWAHALNLGQAIEAVWRNLFGLRPLRHLSAGPAWFVFGALAASSALLLARKVRAVVVVR